MSSRSYREEVQKRFQPSCGPAQDGAGPPPITGEHLTQSASEFLSLGRLCRPVPQDDVRDLVPHHARDLGFRPGRFDHAAVQEHRSAGQRERVDLAKIDDVEAVAEFRLPVLGRDGADETLADPLREVLDAVIVQHRHLLPDLGRRLLTELDVLLG